jgi:cytochrome c oxidase cbb3-type subunit 3
MQTLQLFRSIPNAKATALSLLLFIGSLCAFNAHADSRGEALYNENCAICHGEDGSGGMGIPLSSASFLDAASTHYIKQTIRLGRPGRVMPSFYWMPEADIEAIIDYINSWRKTPPRVWSARTIEGNPQTGKQLYQTYCASCHGENAQGGKGTGMHFSRPTDIPVTATALNNQGFLHSVADEMLYFIIKYSRQGSIMPAASQLGLSRQQINDIVSYIRSFQRDDLHKDSLYAEEPPTLMVESPYSFEETLINVKRAIAGANFIHIRDQALTEGLDVTSDKGSRQTMVYFCNFNFLYDALKIDPRVGMFLPCRITITEQDGKVQMMSINPKHLSQLFNNNALDESCDKMYELYLGILEDASL